MLAALGLLLGLAAATPAGAQDGGDGYTTAGPTDRDADGNGIPDDVEDTLLGADLGDCSVDSYTVGEPFTLDVPSPVDGNFDFVLNQYSESIRLYSGTAPSGSVEVTSPLAGEHIFIFFGSDADGNEASAGCVSTGVEVGGKSTPNTPSNPNTPGTTGGTSGTSGTTGTPSTGTSGTSGSGTSGATSSGGTTGGGSPLANTGFGAALPSLLATALVVGGGLLMITVARRRRQS
ncbi:MAG: hypothetical protein KDB24_11050 [Microthrixaceae bacterium]|nr:hypothetical protein [Microthrixaceae bacterium]